MVNNNTLEMLNRLGFGLDIDKLETYIFDYKKASRLSDISRYSYNYFVLRGILQKLKPSSPALKEISIIDRIPLDTYDVYFKEYQNKHAINIFGDFDSSKIQSIKDEIFEGTDRALDLVAIVNIEGLDVSVVYSYGDLMGIYAISESDKLIELTDKLGYKLPDYIEEFQEEDVVELRGKITILNTKDIVNNAICDSYSYIRRGINTDKLSFIFNDIFFESQPKTYWEKINLIRQLKLSVPHHCLVRNIDDDLFNQAIKEIDKNFVSENIIYPNYGFLIKINNKVNSYDFVLNYITTDANSGVAFTSHVKSISITGDKYYINIVPVKCNEHLTIDKIQIIDIYDIEKHKIKIGSKIKFNIAEGVAYIQ